MVLQILLATLSQKTIRLSSVLRLGLSDWGFGHGVSDVGVYIGVRVQKGQGALVSLSK